MWQIQETEHYIFNYKSGSLAEKEIVQIIDLQENCYREITDTLKFVPQNRIRYWLCDTRKEVKEVSGFEYEVNGVTYTTPEDPRIYAVYNEEKKCVGYHEDTHAIACQYASPNSAAIVEGLAMHFDKGWWKIPNELCTYVYIRDKRYVPIKNMITDEKFYETADMISYPIMGAFTSFLIKKYGIEKYLKLYQKQDDWIAAFENIYHVQLSVLEEKFVQTIMEMDFWDKELAEAGKTLMEVLTC